MKRTISFLLILLISLSLFAGTDGKTFALVLSGGGARGLAHIAVIEELERRGIVTDLVVGTSMGGLVGGLYAAGYSSDEMLDLVLSSDIQSAFFSVSDQEGELVSKAYDKSDAGNLTVDFSENGLGNKDAVLDDWDVNRIIHQAICKVEYVDSFSDLSVPFVTVGTNYLTGEGIVFDSGSLYEAMRGTMSMPVFFPALMLDDGTYVVDGGVYDNMPVDLARDLGADVILAVDVNESLIENASPDSVVDSITSSLNHYLNLIGQYNSRQQYGNADYLLIPDTSEIGVADFSDIIGIVQTGRDCVDDNQNLFDELEEELGEREKDSPVSYSDRQSQVITGFDFPTDLERYREHFTSFIGEEYSGETLEELDRLFRQLRKMAGKLTLDYHLGQGGVVEVSARDYAHSTRSLTVGLSGGLHSFTDVEEEQFRLVLDPDLTLSFSSRHGRLDFDIDLLIGQQNVVSLSLMGFLDQGWAVDVSAHGGFGGFSSISDRVYEYRYPTRDWNFGLYASLVFFSGISHRLDLEAGYDFYYLGDGERSIHVPDGGSVLWDQRFHNVPYLKLSYVFDARHLESQKETGFDLECALGAGWDQNFFLTFQCDFDSTILVSQKADFIDFSLSLFSSSGHEDLLASWHVDSFGQRTRDFIWASLSYRKYPFYETNGFYVTAGVFAQGHADEWNGRNSHIPFADMDSWEAGVSLSVGYASDFGDITIAFHGSFTGRMSLSVEVR